MFNCSCCGTEVTSPYFYMGGVYGYTCIKKVNPNAKKNKLKSKVFEVEVVKILWRDVNSNLDGYGQAIVIINCEKLRVRVMKKLSECGKFFLDEIDYIGNFDFYNGKYWAVV